MELYLREVEKNDMDLLFEWVNDPEVRNNAFNSEMIPYENHVKWFEIMYQRKDVYMFIMCNEDNTPIGQIRLNVEDDNAIIDYSIDGDIRGMGFGANMLWLVIEKIQKEIPEIKRLVGQVKHENAASARAFEKCGFFMEEKEDYIEFFIEL